MRQVLLLALLPALWGAMPAPANLGGARDVVVLYHDVGTEPPRGENVYTAVEATLNHLGLVAHFHDVAKGVPDAAFADRSRGIVSLTVGADSPDPAALTAWLRARHAAGRPIVFTGGAGVLQESRAGVAAPSAEVNALFADLGFQPLDTHEQAAAAFQWVPGGMPAFEAAYPQAKPEYASVRRLDARMESLLAMRPATGGPPEDVAVVGPGGGYLASQELLIEMNPITYRMRWRLDPFRFFGQALGIAGFPALDPSTVNGRRAFFAHIDGDGFTNMSVEPKSRMAAEVVRDDLLARTWLPTTVSVIASEIIGKQDRVALARSLYRLPNVEAGVHSWNHPHDWAKNTLTPTGGTGDAGGESDITGGKTMIFTPKREIDDGVKFVQSLLPLNKRVAIELWSGRTNPPAAFLARTQALGIANLNGGDALLQPGAPSLAAVAPLARRVGAYIQPYATSANENLFTNLWTGPFDGQRQALAFYRYTDRARRMCAVNIYYHFYAAERRSGLAALQSLYAWSEKAQLAPVTAAQYARSVEGFFSAVVTRDGDAAWRVANAGTCRSVRFDGEPRIPDIAASEHVAGWNRVGNRLWVHLAGPNARIVLSASPPNRPRLLDASASLVSWRTDENSLFAAVDAAAPCHLTLVGLPAQAKLRYTGDFTGPATAAADGHVTVKAGRGRRYAEIRW